MKSDISFIGLLKDRETLGYLNTRYHDKIDTQFYSRIGEFKYY